MGANSDDTLKQQREIQSSLQSVVVNADNWLRRLRRRQFQIRVISSVLTIFLAFFATLIAGAFVALLSANLLVSSDTALSNNLNLYVQQHPNVLIAVALLAFLIAPISGVVTYLLLRRKHEGQLRELSSLIKQIKLKLGDYDRQQKRKNADSDYAEGIIQDAFSLTDQILNLLPEVARNRNQESVLFGLIGFLAVAVVVQNFVVAIIAGVAVWLLFRYQARKTYKRELAKFEEQKRIYDERKDDFLATL